MHKRLLVLARCHRGLGENYGVSDGAATGQADTHLPRPPGPSYTQVDCIAFRSRIHYTRCSPSPGRTNSYD